MIATDAKVVLGPSVKQNVQNGVGCVLSSKRSKIIISLCIARFQIEFEFCSSSFFLFFVLFCFVPSGKSFFFCLVIFVGMKLKFQYVQRITRVNAMVVCLCL